MVEPLKHDTRGTPLEVFKFQPVPLAQSPLAPFPPPPCPRSPHTHSQGKGWHTRTPGGQTINIIMSAHKKDQNEINRSVSEYVFNIYSVLWLHLHSVQEWGATMAKIFFVHIF